MNTSRNLSSIAISAFLVMACGGGDNMPADTASLPALDTAAGAASGMTPDTTAESLWAHLTSQNYQQWQLWPGKNRLYSGADPHGALLTTYVNQIASDAIASKAGQMPPGAIVVKENYMPDSTLAAVTVMHKVPGYDSANRDWYWLKRNADGSIDMAGRGGMCAQCHGKQSGNDYIFTGSLSQ
jgi:hypothetical protein